jgi:hypothetical protein
MVLRLAPVLHLLAVFHSVHEKVCMDVELVTKRVRAEFEEMPGMTLTMRQASRLFGIDGDVCRKIFDRLVRMSFLRWTPAGAVTRVAR